MISAYLVAHLDDAFTCMIETFLTNIRASLSDLAEGKLSPWIVTPTTLKNTIKDIQKLLDADNSGYKILTSDPSYYYKFAKFTMLRNNSVIYLSLQFPLTTFMGSFTPYKVMSFPVPINSSNNHVSQLLDLSVYLLISADKTFMLSCQKKLFRNVNELIRLHTVFRNRICGR